MKLTDDAPALSRFKAALARFEDSTRALLTAFTGLPREQQAEFGAVLMRMFTQPERERAVAEEAVRAALGAEAVTLMKFHPDSTGRLTLCTRERVARAQLAQRITELEQRAS
jgi:hypothetical protein